MVRSYTSLIQDRGRRTSSLLWNWRNTLNAEELSAFFNAGQDYSFKRETVSFSIANIIIDYLMAQKLQPGDQLPTEQEFMAHLGVGRNSVREAIKMLTFLGVVEIRKGVGSFVSSKIPTSALNPLILSLAFEQGLSMDLVELRILIDTGVGDLVIDKVDQNGIDLLETANERIVQFLKNPSGNSTSFHELDFSFHELLFKLAENPLVEKIGMAVYKLFNFAMEKSMVSDPKQAYLNHKLIIQAIQDRDKVKLKENTRESLAVWSQFV